MTLVEFLAPLKRNTHSDRVLAVLYYLLRYADTEMSTVAQIRSSMQRARAKSWRTLNVADILAKSAPHVESPGKEGTALLWRLTKTGQNYVRELLGLPEAEPEVEHDVATLEKVAIGISDGHVRGYVEEAIQCLRFGALRASVVFLWSGAIRTIQEGLLARHGKALNVALTRHDPKARKVTRIDHFAYIRDATTLLAAQEVGELDKSEQATLKEALDLRNRCGHPGKYRLGVKKTSSFVEDVVGIVF